MGSQAQIAGFGKLGRAVPIRRLCCNWLIGCFGFNDPLRVCFSLYRAVSQREGKKEET